MELSKEQIREIIAKRIAKELKHGDVVTLGIGLPTEAAHHIPEDINVLFQSENGIVGIGKNAEGDDIDIHVTNASGAPVIPKPGAAYFDCMTAFTMIRGGHVNTTVLGALEVDQEGNLANWLVPGVFAPGMGGAMDLVVGAKQVIVAMEHLAKGKSKILKKCTLPLTAQNQVNMIITERCVLDVSPEGLILKELHPHFSLDDVLSTVQADIIVPDSYQIMAV